MTIFINSKKKINKNKTQRKQRVKVCKKIYETRCTQINNSYNVLFVKKNEFIWILNLNVHVWMQCFFLLFWFMFIYWACEAFCRYFVFFFCFFFLFF